MKILKLQFLLVLMASLVFVTGCKDDDEKEVSPFVGNYVISKATIIEQFTLNVSFMGGIIDVPVSVGQDITEAIQGSLLSQVDCDSPDKSWVELRDDNKIIMSCEGANILDAGTWEEVSATELKLNMNSAAIPSSPAGFVLTVTDIAVAGSKMTGNTSVPMPAEMFAEMLAAMGMTLTENNPDVFVVKFSIEFNKQ